MCGSKVVGERERGWREKVAGLAAAVVVRGKLVRRERGEEREREGGGGRGKGRERERGEAVEEGKWELNWPAGRGWETRPERRQD